MASARLGDDFIQVFRLDNDACGQQVPCTVPAVTAVPSCADGKVDVQLGENCDDGNAADLDCCSSACQVEGAGTICGPQLDICVKESHCDGNIPVCRNGAAEPVTQYCEAEPCTLEDHCVNGQCTSGRRVCDVTAKQAKPGKDGLVTCFGDAETEGCELSGIEVRLVPQAEAVGLPALKPARVCPADPSGLKVAPIPVGKPRRTSAGGLRIRGRIRLKLTPLGRKLLRCGRALGVSGDVNVRRAPSADVPDGQHVLKGVVVTLYPPRGL